ncbi:transposase, partial [Arthrospira platensis SPKY2]
MRTAYFWPIYGEQDEICFPYSSDRNHANVAAILGDAFTGVLLTDGYSAYEQFAKQRADVIKAECWSHSRRHFERALNAEPQAAGQALEHIAGLYAVE